MSHVFATKKHDISCLPFPTTRHRKGVTANRPMTSTVLNIRTLRCLFHSNPYFTRQKIRSYTKTIYCNNSIIPQTPPAQHKNRHQKPRISPTPQLPETLTSPTSTNKTAHGFPRPSPPSHYPASAPPEIHSAPAKSQTPA